MMMYKLNESCGVVLRMSQVVQPDLVKYLKMSPRDRGAKLPPYVKAKRLTNGAMQYTRSPIADECGDPVDYADSCNSSSPFKRPAVCDSVRSRSRAYPPWEVSKQQQLDTDSVSTNGSIVIQVRED